MPAGLARIGFFVPFRLSPWRTETLLDYTVPADWGQIAVRGHPLTTVVDEAVLIQILRRTWAGEGEAEYMALAADLGWVMDRSTYHLVRDAVVKLQNTRLDVAPDDSGPFRVRLLEGFAETEPGRRFRWTAPPPRAAWLFEDYRRLHLNRHFLHERPMALALHRVLALEAAPGHRWTTDYETLLQRTGAAWAVETFDLSPRKLDPLPFLEELRDVLRLMTSTGEVSHYRIDHVRRQVEITWGDPPSHSLFTRQPQAGTTGAPEEKGRR